MHITKNSQIYFVRLDIGEDVIASLQQLAMETKLPTATLMGIGAIKNVELGYFDVHHREYQKKTFSHDVELLSLNGNISWLEENPVVHAHVIVSGPDFVAHGGHLFSAEVAVTLELCLTPLAERLSRRMDARFQLNLLQNA